MKRILLLSSLFLLTLSGYSQTEKGHFLVGGNGRFYRSQSSDLGKNTVELDVNAGYFVINHMAIGIMGGYGYITGLEDKYQGQLFVRYYVPITSVVAPYIQGSGGYRYRVNSGFNGNKTKFYGPMVGGRIGAAFFLNPHVSFDTFFYLDNTSEKNRFSDGSESKPIETMDYGVGIGFQIFLGKGG